MAVRNMGVPLSLESIHALLVDKGITKLDFRSEKLKYDKEMESAGFGLTGTGTEPSHNEEVDENGNPIKKEVEDE